METALTLAAIAIVLLALRIVPYVHRKK